MNEIDIEDFKMKKCAMLTIEAALCIEATDATLVTEAAL